MENKVNLSKLVGLGKITIDEMIAIRQSEIELKSAREEIEKLSRQSEIDSNARHTWKNEMMKKDSRIVLFKMHIEENPDRLYNSNCILELLNHYMKDEAETLT